MREAKGRMDGIKDREARKSGGIGPDYDYSKDQSVDGRGHNSDAGKLPNHPTFSDQSDYANEKTPGGHWGNKNGKDTYTPSVQMVTDGRAAGLGRYMKRVEPRVKLEAPIPMDKEYFNREIKKDRQ